MTSAGTTVAVVMKRQQLHDRHRGRARPVTQRGVSQDNFAAQAGLPTTSQWPWWVGVAVGYGGGWARAACRLANAGCQGQRSGRCTVSRRALRASRAGTLTRWARTVPVAAVACHRAASARRPGSGWARSSTGWPRRRWRRTTRRAGVPGPSLGVGDELCDDGVAAVVGLGLPHHERAGDEHGVVAPDVAQPVLPGWGVQAVDPAPDQPARGAQPRGFRRERYVAGLGDLGVGDQLPGVGVDEGVRIVDRWVPSTGQCVSSGRRGVD